MTVLEIRNLSVFFSRYYNWFRKRTEACLNGLELSVGAGQLVAVIGSSGSGKSLLAHAVMGILPRNAGWSGQMLYKGELLTPQLQQRLRGRELALVPQSVSYLNPLMQVGKQVRMSGGGVRSRTELRSMFRRYGLESQVERMYPFQLSGGMMRRVLVSTATLGGAELIIADEPTSGLHAELAQETVMRFRELADEGSAVLLITHDLESVLPYADAIAVLYGGTSIEVAPAHYFSGDGTMLRHPYSRALWTALPRNEFTPPKGKPLVRPARSAAGCPYREYCESASEACRSGQIPVRRVNEGWVRCIDAT
ncbi:ABC transporter ATP-binding protein [Paenibacillus pinihumi]|uniref:ATP-binding cassette domain-containing protein n=1 Tax=Paenibacillus pinihumi TaxID=669462 RepID=UPI000427CB65|nr:ABC transporter ATP-binding protein [Paenibacillus pinihumi]